MEQTKILSVFGSPASGKTVTAIKLGLELTKHKKNVAIVTLDSVCPVIPYILESTIVHETSIGELFSKPSLSQNEILSACVLTPENKHISFLGYKLGESQSQFPKIIASKVLELIVNLSHAVDYVIIDCTTTIENDVATITSLQLSDAVLKLGTADLKGISYFHTADKLLADSKFRKDRQFTAISNFKTGQEWEMVSAQFENVKFMLPYCKELEKQMQELRLFETLKQNESAKYNVEIAKIARDIFSLATPLSDKKSKTEHLKNIDNNKKERKLKLPKAKEKAVKKDKFEQITATESTERSKKTFKITESTEKSKKKFKLPFSKPKGEF